MEEVSNSTANKAQCSAKAKPTAAKVANGKVQSRCVPENDEIAVHSVPRQRRVVVQLALNHARTLGRRTPLLGGGRGSALALDTSGGR